MMNFEVGDFVLVLDRWYCVVEDIDDDGDFICCGDDGEDYEWNVEHVESVDSPTSFADKDLEMIDDIDEGYMEVCPFD